MLKPLTMSGFFLLQHILLLNNIFCYICCLIFPKKKIQNNVPTNHQFKNHKNRADKLA
jgi:hypothetical protein